ncbi:hypothetical protein U1Q18_031323 [Sarracenia purpurea var. burkii]
MEYYLGEWVVHQSQGYDHFRTSSSPPSFMRCTHQMSRLDVTLEMTSTPTTTFLDPVEDYMDWASHHLMGPMGLTPEVRALDAATPVVCDKMANRRCRARSRTTAAARPRAVA